MYIIHVEQPGIKIKKQTLRQAALGSTHSQGEFSSKHVLERELYRPFCTACGQRSLQAAYLHTICPYHANVRRELSKRRNQRYQEARKYRRRPKDSVCQGDTVNQKNGWARALFKTPQLREASELENDRQSKRCGGKAHPYVVGSATKASSL